MRPDPQLLHPLPPDARLLVLVNPGRLSRNYMLGIANAAQSIGLPHLALDLEPLWLRLGFPGPVDPATRALCHRDIAALVTRHRITHVISYAFNGINDIGLTRRADTSFGPLFASLGIRHIMLWTDHPNWCTGGLALRPEFVQHLGHPLHTHIVKSASAAAEVRAVLGWPNVHHMPMAEDYDLLQPARDIEPLHDIVAITGYCLTLPDVAVQMLDSPDPDLHAIDRDVAQRIRAKLSKVLAADPCPEAALAGHLLARVMDARLASPNTPVWTILQTARSTPDDETALRWMRSQPQRWYTLTDTIRRSSDWRRSFWLAWLARRYNLGIYGHASASIGVAQPDGAEAWVDYASQPAVYSRGRIAFTCNSGVDEEGPTHKVFQIAGSGAACLHHNTPGLDELFEPAREIELFDDGPSLQAATERLLSDPGHRHRVAEAGLQRARRSHNWGNRLSCMIGLASGATSEPPENCAASVPRLPQSGHAA